MRLPFYQRLIIAVVAATGLICSWHFLTRRGPTKPSLKPTALMPTTRNSENTAKGLPKFTPGEQALADEVKATLDELQPDNPGREKTFGKLYLVAGDPANPRRIPLRRKRWMFMVLQVTPLPDGWRANVSVNIRATNSQGALIMIMERHLETYLCKDGKISLEQESVAPEWHPASDGLSGIMM